jgi:hypothetical protein
MEYEHLQSEKDGLTCKNYKLCERVLPPDCLDCIDTRICRSCVVFGWNELQFTKRSETCTVCNEPGHDQVKFPEHDNDWHCVSCTRRILFWNQNRYCISPVPFGCPPCPNKCLNPENGKQCDCETYDEILKMWKREHPRQYKEYSEAEHAFLEHVIGNAFRSNQRCLESKIKLFHYI